MEITKQRYKYNSRPTKRPKKRGFKVWLLLLVFVASSFSYAFLALGKDTSRVGAESGYEFSRKSSEVSIAWPTSGWSAIGDRDQGLLASSPRPDKPLPTASMAKVITALAVLDKRPLSVGEQGQAYTITSEDVAIYNGYVAKYGSVMQVTEGQVLSQYQLLEALMLPSANNIADTLANDVFGSQQEYVEYANSLLSSYGLKDTSVDDASGFSPLTVSTPSDMIEIGQKALQDPVLSQIVATKTAIIPGTGEIKNSNQMLNDSNVVGIKTGTTDEAGSCLLFAVRYGPDLSELMIGVVMGQPNWTTAYRDARLLRDSALTNFKTIELIPIDTVVAKYQSDWGQASDIKTKGSLSIYGWVGNDYLATIETEDISPPVALGETVGKATVVGSDISTDLILANSISSPGVIWRLINYW